MKAVNRRNFLNGTAGAISGAVLLSTDSAAEGANQSLSLEQAAEFLHELVGRHAGRNAQVFDDQRHSELCDDCRDNSIRFMMENLRFCSVDDVRRLLKPMFEGGVS